ncbi:unnamed protein product [Prorocentrum cordatum]|uniref:Uncharacterized protein n=1 Tax=Prorocentrum cordatum TaxID=2364126 RepID=A0ABN9U255_9DINO|nr:unnamed protein product [Polarella glacialis]
MLHLDRSDVAMIESLGASRIWARRAVPNIAAGQRVHQRDQAFGDNVAARKSGVYPDKFCRAATACANDAAADKRAGGPGPMGGGEDFAETHDAKADETVDGRIGRAELALPKRLHVNVSHLSDGDLGRSLQLIGAKLAVVQAAQGPVGAARLSRQRPSARRPARLHFVPDFGDDAGFDYFELKGAEDKNNWYFRIVGLATTSHVATLIDNDASQEFAPAFERCWASWARVLDRVHAHMETGSGGALSELLQFSTRRSYLPLDRRIYSSELAARTIEHSSVKDKDEMHALGIVASGSKNSLRRRAGFSPAQSQWALGRDPKTAADLADDAADCSTRSLAANDEKIRRRHAIRTAARESFM